MNELERILQKDPADRLTSELEYLIAHESELTDDQKAQLETEKTIKSPMCRTSGESKADCVKRKIPEIMRDNPEMEQDQAIAMAESMCSKECKTEEEVEEETIEHKDSEDEVKAQFKAVIKDEGEGVIEAIIASDTEDRHGEILDIKGLNIKNYMKNPIVAWGHNYDEPPIAKATKLTKTKDGKLVAKMAFATDIYEKAKTVYELYKGGFMKAFSIGFIPQEMDGNKYVKSEMIEFSAVLVPANPDALMLAKKKGLDIENLTAYNINRMDIKALLEKVEKEGIDALTLGEVKFLNEHKDDLTANQIKTLASVLDEPKDDEDPKPDEDTQKAISDLTATVKGLEEKLAEVDKGEVKDISGQGDPKKTITASVKEVSKEMKFLLFAKGLQTGDFSQYREIVGKAAMSTSEPAEVIPPNEFVLEVERLEEEVGVAARFANVRRSTSGAGIKFVMGDDDLEIFDTAESGKKKSTKLTYKQLLLAWRKFAGILPITDELNEDSALDLWNDATQRFARAFAKRADQLVFTEVAAGGNTKDGIINVAGTNTVTIAAGNSIDDVVSDELYDMVYGVPTQSASGGRFYLNRTILGVLAKLKDQENRTLWQPSIAEGVPATIAGKPYTEVEVLPGVNEDDSATAFAVFGDLRYATLAERTGLNIKIFDTGSVGDPDDEDQDDASDLNLLTQDIQAMRAVKRMNAVVRFPEAFSVLKTAGIS